MLLPSTTVDGILRFLDAGSLWKLQDLNCRSLALVTAHERDIVKEALVSPGQIVHCSMKSIRWSFRPSKSRKSADLAGCPSPCKRLDHSGH